MRILPHHGESKGSNFLTIARLVVAAGFAVFGILTQFNVTINKEVTRPQIVQRVEVAKGQLVHKDGKVTEAQCYMFAKRKGNIERTDLIDTYGVPSNGQVDDSFIDFPLREDRWRSCSLQFDYDGNLRGVSIDLYYDSER